MLFDTPLQLEAWNSLLEETQGRRVPEEEFLQSANGRTSRETVEYFWGEDVTPQQVSELIQCKRRRYRELCMEHPEIFHLAEGLPEVLDLLMENGVPFTIATSSGPDSVDFYFEHLGLARWFDRDAIICSDRKFPGKPAPDIYRIAAQQLGMEPERCIVVEDAAAGAQAARSAGIGRIVLVDADNAGIARNVGAVDCEIHHYDEMARVLRAALAKSSRQDDNK